MAAGPSSEDPLRQLSELLREGNAVPRLRPERIVGSSIYDAVYRAGVIALTIQTCGRHGDGQASLHEQILRLFQFVAVHPALLRPLQHWVAERQAGNLAPFDEWAKFPAGYATDALYDQVLTYLLAAHHLRRERAQISLAQAAATPFLVELLKYIESNQLFAPERAVLNHLRGVKVTLGMLH